MLINHKGEAFQDYKHFVEGGGGRNKFTPPPKETMRSFVVGINNHCVQWESFQVAG